MMTEQEQQKIDLAEQAVAAETHMDLAEQVNRLTLLLSKARFAEYVELMQRPWSLLWRSFVSGVFKGMGFALGFLLLSALALYILNLLVDLGIPILGDFIAQLLEYIKDVQRARGL